MTTAPVIGVIISNLMRLSVVLKLELDGLGQVKLCEHPGTVEIAFGLGGIFIQHAEHGMFGGS